MNTTLRRLALLLLLNVAILAAVLGICTQLSAASGQQETALLSDSTFLYSSSMLSFDTQTFLEGMPGPLAHYSENVDGNQWSAAEIIDYNAMRTGINPQVLLVLLEVQGNLLSSENANVPIVEPEYNNTLYRFVASTSEQLLTTYDRARYSEITQTPVINAATDAIRTTLAISLPERELQSWIDGNQPRFIRVYEGLFSSPLDGTLHARSPQKLPDNYMLPFAAGETWYLTSGPHNYVGGTVGCGSGGGCPRPWSSIDIAPPESIGCPGGAAPANRWVVAAQSGTVVESSQALVVIEHEGGWRTYYSHMADDDRIEEDIEVDQGDRIGHPSCEVEPGGITTGVHLHFAIWQEDSGFEDIDESILSNWEIGEDTHYNGVMSRNNITRTADAARIIGTNDILNSAVLLSDTFSDGNFDNWTIVDAEGATSGPSDWAVVQAKNSYVLRQNSNILTDEHFEGTYVYAGQDWWTNYNVNLEIEPDDNDGLFVLFRYTDDNNYYRFFMDRERSVRRLEKKVDGVYTTLAEDLTQGYGTAGWTNVQIAVNGSSLKVELDYESIFEVTDSSFVTGSIGVGTWASRGAHFDNIIVATSTTDPYADEVVDASISNGGNGFADTSQILGRPNGDDYDFLSIGGPGYWIILDMGEAEEIIDGRGNDIRVYEIGSIFGGVDEEYDVFVSDSPDGPWHYVGEGWTTSLFDLSGTGLDSARYVKIEDLSTRTGNPTPGSDIDAVQIVNMAGDLILSPPSTLGADTIGNDVVLSWPGVESAEEYRVYASRAGGGIGFTEIGSVSAFTRSPETVEDIFSFTHRNAANDELYYAVTAIGSEGYESNFSLEIPVNLFLPMITRN